MQRKLDFRCHRVKSLSFHPYRHWLVCGLHTGVIYMIDYRLDSVVDVFVEHEGSVRAIDFHQCQPLFVSGSDDFLVKVWNYNLRRCLFTLSGHTDYIRTTFFHAVQPWIVSASDDHTVRLWNWQNRSCMATLPGHGHFVMCANFIPQETQLISCSLDKTIRVWDISTVQEDAADDFGLAEFLGTADVAVLHEVQAHDNGVNYVACHPTENFVVSCSDDRTIRVWKISGKAFLLVGRALGHVNSVTSAVFFKKYIVSTSEDRSIRVWDGWRNTSFRSIRDFRRTSDRYWIIAKSEQRNLLAAGHDTGCEIFKLARERPAIAINGDNMYYTFDGNIRYFNFATSKTQELKNTPSQSLAGLRGMCLNPENNAVTVWFDFESSKTFDLETMRTLSGSAAVTDVIRTGPNKFVARSQTEKQSIMTYSTKNGVNTMDKRTTNFNVTRMFPSSPGTVLCLSENKLLMYHLAQRTIAAELPIFGVKYVVWDQKFQRVALLSKNSITVASKNLSVITVVSETAARIKSAVFDETREILYFSTSYHLKYCNLLNGEVSTISTLRNVIYLVRAVGDVIYYISRSGEILFRELDNSELIFKQKLHQKSYREVIQILQKGKLKGQALVGYLHKHQYSEVALQFVKDPLTRFYLALECGIIEVAKEMAAELDDPNTWKKLSETALLFGDIQLAQLASTKANNYRNTAFLSLITGNTSAVSHLVDSTPDEHFRMLYGLYLDDARQRIRVLVDAGQLSLAYLTAKSYEMDDLAEAIAPSLSPTALERLSTVAVKSPSPRATIEPATENWPMLRVEDSIFSRLLKDPSTTFQMEENINLEEVGGAWADNDDVVEELQDGLEEDVEDAAEGAGWGDDEELDIDVNATLSKAKASGQKRAFVAPAASEPVEKQWTQAVEPVYHIAAGSFDTAFSILKKQICLSNPAALKHVIMKLWSCVNAARPAWSVPSTSYVLTQASDEYSALRSRPLLPNLLVMMEDQLKQGYQMFVLGKFTEALQSFENILHIAVFTTVKDDRERRSITDLISKASEYARALQLQIQLKLEDPNSPRALAMALYFTHFALLAPHMVLALSQAMTKAYKKENFCTAARLAQRLLEQEPPKAKADQARAIIIKAENKEDNLVVEYDGLNPFQLCCVSYTPMYRGATNPLHCPHCNSPSLPTYRNTLCPVCKLSPLGTEGLGLWNE